MAINIETTHTCHELDAYSPILILFTMGLDDAMGYEKTWPEIQMYLAGPRPIALGSAFDLQAGQFFTGIPHTGFRQIHWPTA
jgi:hypothetical protein